MKDTGSAVEFHLPDPFDVSSLTVQRKLTRYVEKTAMVVLAAFTSPGSVLKAPLNHSKGARL